LVINHHSILDLVTSEIRESILSGKFEPGEHISQAKLANALGVSRTPVREALRKLEIEGLVTFYPNRGILISVLSSDEFMEIYRIREELELLAIDWLAENLSELKLPLLRKLFNKIKDAENKGNVSKRLQATRDFHFEILRLSKRPHLLRLINGLWDQTEYYRRIYSAIAGVQEERLLVFETILKACESHDVQAIKDAYKNQFMVVRKILIPHLAANESVDDDR